MVHGGRQMEVERVVACGAVEAGGLVCAWAHHGLSPVRRPFYKCCDASASILRALRRYRESCDVKERERGWVVSERVVVLWGKEGEGITWADQEEVSYCFEASPA